MGMFDYVRCEYPLPGLSDPTAFEFQTKDTDEQYLSHYVITKDGRLTLKGKDQNFHGQLDIGWSNVCASAAGAVFTLDGSDAWYLDFSVVFTNGSVAHVEVVDNHKEPALASSERRRWTLPTPEEKRQIEEREGESLLGRRMVLWYGGDTTEPFYVKVVGENDHRLSVESETGEFIEVYRSDRDRLLFDSMEDGQAYKDHRKKEWDDEIQEYQSKLAAKAATKP